MPRRYYYEAPESVFVILYIFTDEVLGAYTTREAAEDVLEGIPLPEQYLIFQYNRHEYMQKVLHLPTLTKAHD